MVSEEHGISVPIITIYLTYFWAQQQYGCAVLEYGCPIWIDLATLTDFCLSNNSQ